jgi:ABC-type transporter lipoprotein component MlaA
MIYVRKKEYEVIRIDKIILPVSVAYMSITPLIMRPGLSMVPPNCSAVLDRSVPMLGQRVDWP